MAKRKNSETLKGLDWSMPSMSIYEITTSMAFTRIRSGSWMGALVNWHQSGRWQHGVIEFRGPVDIVDVFKKRVEYNDSRLADVILTITPEALQELLRSQREAKLITLYL